MTEAEKFARGRVPLNMMINNLRDKAALRKRLEELEKQSQLDREARHTWRSQMAERENRFSLMCIWFHEHEQSDAAVFMERFMNCDDKELEEIMR